MTLVETPPAPPPPDSPPPQLPAVFATAALGWRRWLVTDQGELCSPLMRTHQIWSPESSPVFTARCGYGHPHPPLSPVCGCGLYAYHAPPQRTFWPHCVWGVVVGAGAARVHAQGWRAERVQILGLIAPEPPPQTAGLFSRATGADLARAELAAARYEVPLWSDLSEAEAALARSGLSPIAEEERPPLPSGVKWRERIYLWIAFGLVPAATALLMWMALTAGGDGILIAVGIFLITLIASLLSPDPWVRDLLAWMWRPQRSISRVEALGSPAESPGERPSAASGRPRSPR